MQSKFTSGRTATKRDRSGKALERGRGRRRALLSSLRMEQLERRELLAGDVMHNDLIPEDVNSDFRVTPLDVLSVINHLNNRGRSRGEGEAAATQSGSTSRPLRLDVNNDQSVTPMDLLRVINTINAGEGEPFLAQVNVVAVDGSGVPLTSQIVDGVTEYVVGVGQSFFLRTQVRDIRTDPQGVAQVYLDVDVNDDDATPGLNVAADFTEVQLINLVNVNGGSFTLVYNGTETSTITVATNSSGQISIGTTAQTVQAALTTIFGSGNVAVRGFGSGNNVQFEVRFIGALTSTDIPDPQKGQVNLTAPNGVADLVLDTEVDALVNYPSEPNRIEDENGTLLPLRYGRFATGGLLQPTPSFIQINEVGGFFESPIFEAFTVLDPGRYANIFDVSFDAVATGVSIVTTNVADRTSSVLLVGGTDEELPASSIQFSAPIRINVVARVQAVNDVFPRTGGPAILEDAGSVLLTGLTANDIVRQGNLIGIQSVTQPAGNVGTVSFAVGGSDVTFTPAANFFGTATFTYTIANDQGDRSTGTVSVTVDPVNDPPAPVSPLPTFSIAEDSATPLTITAAEVFNAGPGETGAVRFSPATQLAPGSSGGTLTVDANGNLVFNPAANFFGTVLVDAVAIDDLGAASAPVRLTITVTPVNDAPIPLGPSFSTIEDTLLILTPSQLFTAGPANEVAQAITLSNAQLAPGASGGFVTVDASTGNLVFTPDLNFFGSVAIRVTGTDNGTPMLATEGTFTVNVTPFNDPPTAVNDDFVVQGVLSIEQSLPVLDNDSAGPANETSSDLRITRVFNQSGPGTLRIAEDGRTVLYTPPAGVPTGSASFTYEITDTVAGTLTSQANVAIEIVPPVLPFAVRDTRTVAEGSGPVTVDVLANDLVNDGQSKILVDFTQPASGTVTRDPGSLADISDDRLVFTPSSIEFFGTVTFEYTLDDTGADSDPSIGTVTITVTAVNDAPSLVSPPTQQTSEDVVDFRIPASTLLAGSSAGPLEGDQSLTVTSARVLSGGGSVEVRGGELFFSAATDSVQDVLVEYTATDNGTTNAQPDPRSSTATVLIRLSPINDVPVASPDVATTAEDQSVLIPASTILGNDRVARASAIDEPGTQSLQITGVRVLSGGGSATLENGSIRFIPAGNFNGGAVLEYTITDVNTGNVSGFVAMTATSTINVTVTEVNDAPANFAATRSVFAGLPTRLDFAVELAGTSRGAANESTQTLVIRRIVSGPDLGTATVNADGSITYNAPIGSSGSTSIVVETIDNGTTNGQADPRTGLGTITVNVQPFQPSTVTGIVYADDDANNIVDTVDLRLGGVEVRLVGTTVAEGGGSVSRTAITDADGTYSFDILPPGTYTVSYVRPVMAIDGPSPDSVTQTVAIPGGVTIVANFSILGVAAPMVSVIDNLAEGYYAQYPNVRGKGIDAVIQADGQMAFSVVRGGYDVDFAEVSMSADGRSVFLTIVDSSGVRVAGVPRGKYFMTKDSAGNTLIRIVALPGELNFTSVGAAPTAARSSPGFMTSVDEYFADLGRA